MKKIIALLLCIIMIVPSFAINVFAGDGWYPMVAEVISWKDLKYEMSGEWVEADDGSSYFLYNAYYAIGKVRLTMNTGEWVDMTYEELQENFSNVYVATSQSAVSPWTECGTYSATLFIEDISCKFSFDIEVGEEEIASFEVLTTKPLIKEYHGTWQTDNINGGEFFSYFAYYAIETVEVTYDSGRTEVMSIGDFNYKFNVTYGGPDAEEEKPSSINPWEPGIHKLSASIDYTDIECEFEVEIIDNPVSAIEVVETRDLIENSKDNGQVYTYIDENGVVSEFYEYDPAVAIKTIRVYFSDGTYEDYTWNYVSYYLSKELGLDLGYCVVRPEYFQEPSAPWYVGNTYNATLEYAGRTADFKVNIISEEDAQPDTDEPGVDVPDTDEPGVDVPSDDAEIVSIDVLETYSLTEYEDGWYDITYLEGDEPEVYFFYPVEMAIGDIRVNYSDGTSVRGDISDFEDIYLEYEQNCNEPWGVGSHEAYICTDNYACEVEIVVVDNGIADVELNSVGPLVNNCDGYYQYEWNEELGDYVEYFYYDVIEAIEGMTVTYDDGTSEEYQGYITARNFVLEDQGYYSQWTLGNTYTATLYIWGEVFEIEVEIVENPVQSIEVVETIPLRENIDGYYVTYWDEEQADWVEYYCYDACLSVLSVKVIYTDGTEEIITLNDDNRHDFNCYDDQWFMHWEVGGTYTSYFMYYGIACEFSVSIVEANEFNYFVNDGGIYIIGLTEKGFANTGSELVIPSEIYGVPVKGILYLDDNNVGIERLVILDGVEMIDYYALSTLYSLKTVILPESITYIGYDCFYDCIALEKVYYNGTEAQWNAIDIDEYNPDLLGAEIIFTEEDEVVAVIGGEVITVVAGTEMEFSAEKLTYDPETGFGYVFVKWNVSGVELDDETSLSVSFDVPNGTFVVEQETFVHGDVSNDGKINALDSASVLKEIKKGDVSALSDLNFDGKVNALDSAILLKIIKGKYYN